MRKKLYRGRGKACPAQSGIGGNFLRLPETDSTTAREEETVPADMRGPSVRERGAGPGC